MKKIRSLFPLLAVASLLMMNTSSNGQRFMHSLGASIYAGGNASALGVTYSPRINLTEIGNEGTLSIGTHLGIAFGGYNSMEGASGDLAFDLPLVAEWNFGHASSEDASSSFGGFLGLGAGFSAIGSEDGSTNRGVGPLFNAGIRTTIREQSVGLRVSYMLNTRKDNGDVFSIGLFYNFGDF